MEFEKGDRDLYEYIERKGQLHRQAGAHTRRAFDALKAHAKLCVQQMQAWQAAEVPVPAERVPLAYEDRGAWEFYLRFADDLLVFTMHTNIFEFSRQHEVMKLPYVKEDKDRSHCGVIFIYNFLADSVNYHRLNDTGYLIGRVFINKDNHYFIEGKRELGLLYSQFNTAVFDEKAGQDLLRAAMEYTAHFDLLTPPYDEIKEMTVLDLEEDAATKPLHSMKTAKRLGFRFQADQ
ncbi:MAG: hypothetical protein K2H70_04315 [Bacteroidales bacterium]|nr:hypothetical protein [Bacteroidales bacterium]